MSLALYVLVVEGLSYLFNYKVSLGMVREVSLLEPNTSQWDFVDDLFLTILENQNSWANNTILWIVFISFA